MRERMEARCLQESARERMSEGVRMECVHREKGGWKAERIEVPRSQGGKIMGEDAGAHPERGGGAVGAPLGGSGVELGHGLQGRSALRVSGSREDLERICTGDLETMLNEVQADGGGMLQNMLDSEAPELNELMDSISPPVRALPASQPPAEQKEMLQIGTVDAVSWQAASLLEDLERNVGQLHTLPDVVPPSGATPAGSPPAGPPGGVSGGGSDPCPWMDAVTPDPAPILPRSSTRTGAHFAVGLGQLRNKGAMLRQASSPAACLWGVAGAEELGLSPCGGAPAAELSPWQAGMWSSQPGAAPLCVGGQPRPSLARSRSDAASLVRSSGPALTIAGKGGGQKGSKGSLHRALSSGSKKKSAKSRAGHRRLGSAEDMGGSRGDSRPRSPQNYSMEYTAEYWRWKKMIAFIQRGLRTKKVLRKKLEGLGALDQIRELQRMSERVGRERENIEQSELPVPIEIPHGSRSPNRRYVGVNLAHGYMADFEHHVGQPCAEKWEARIWIASGEAVDSLPGGVGVAQKALFSTAGATCVPHAGMELHLGYFNSPEQAAERYDRAAVYLRGWKARTNFAKEGYKRDTVLSQTIACQRRRDFVAAALRERDLSHQSLLVLARQHIPPPATSLLQEASNVFVKPLQIQGLPNNCGVPVYLSSPNSPLALVPSDAPPGSLTSLSSMATISD